MNTGSDVYDENVLAELAAGKGVACFAVLDEGHPLVLFASHTLTDKALEISEHPSDYVRAAQAVAIQREARKRASEAGFVIVTP